ncbi:17324_t:CDS:1, partial [Funneliformis caledonium]
MDKNEDFTALPKPKSDLNPDRKNFINTKAATSSNMNSNDSPVDPSPPFRNEGKKRKNIFIPNSFDSNIISVMNDRSTSNLEEPTVQNKGKSKIITKEQDHNAHVSNKRVTNKESIKERYLIKTETVPIQTESKFKNELEGEQRCAKKVKLANGFGEEEQLTNTTIVSIQPKSKGLRMREHDQPRQVVKKAKIANDPGGSGNHH